MNRQQLAPQNVLPLYIGVTGITNLAETAAVSSMCAGAFGSEPPASRRPMVGYLIRQAQLAGADPGNPRFVPFDLLPSLMTATARCALSSIHFLPHGETPLADQIEALMTAHEMYGSGLCRVVQLNMVWPRPEEMRRAKERLPDLKLILPVPPRVLRKRTPEQVAERLAAYRDVADVVLLDPSGGAGRPFTAEFIAPFYRATVDTLPAVTVGLAGGFNADNVEARIVELAATLGSADFCIDAEGGLRDRQETPEPVDRLSLSQVERYLAGAISGFRRLGEA